MHLVLLPGLLCDQAFWKAQSAALEPSQTIAYGLSDSIGAMAERVLAEAPARFALAGHSMGGRVAFEVVARAPERVTKLALLCTDWRAPADESERKRELLERRAMLAQAREKGLEAFARSWALANLAPRHRALIPAVARMVCRQSLDVLAAQTLAGLNRSDYSDLLPRIACPALIVAGAEDRLRSAEGHREMAARVPGSTLVVVDGAAHMAPMEEPRLVTAVMRRWLAHS